MKKILLMILLFSSLAAHAQNWGGGVDDQDFNWGFGFHYVASEFKLIRTPAWREPFINDDPLEGTLGPITDPLKSISSPLSPGFGIGFVINYKFSPHLDLRSTPTLVFNDRIVNYEYEEPLVLNTEANIQKKIESTVVDFPLGIKVKSDRRKDFRAYVMLGAKYSIDLASGKKSKDDDKALIYKFLKNKKNFASYEAALGFDLYFEFFKMSPQIKFSQSFGDILKHEKHPYAAPLDKVILRNFTFSLFFE